MKRIARLIASSLVVALWCTLSTDGSFGATTTIDDSYVRFVLDEDMGSMTELTWKGGSGNELEDQYWNDAHGASPFRLMNVHGGPGYQESGSTIADRQLGIHSYRATFANAGHGSKTLDIRWGDEGLYILISLSLTRADLYVGGLWEPGGNNSNDYLKVYPVSGTPYTQNITYPGGAALIYDGTPVSIGIADHGYDEMFGYRGDLPRRQWVASGLSLDGPFVYVPSGSSTLEFALTSKSNFDEFVAGNWRIGPRELLSINATYLDSTFSATGGTYGNGVLNISDNADIVVEYDTGQYTYDDGSFALSTSLFSDNSSAGIASGLFKGGSLLIQDSDGDNLLAGDVMELQLSEVPSVTGLLAGTGLFEVTGGSLEDPFALDYGEIVQITFNLDPADIDDFSADFTGISNVTLEPIPEPATVSLLLLGSGLTVLLRKRRRN